MAMLGTPRWGSNGIVIPKCHDQGTPTPSRIAQTLYLPGKCLHLRRPNSQPSCYSKATLSEHRVAAVA